METIIEQAYPLSSSSSSSSSSSTQLKSKKLPLKEFNEAYQENEFFVPTSLEHSKISVNQLVSALNNETEFGLLKLQVDQLKKNHTHTQRLLAPLPDHVQAKIRRQTFFKDTKKQLHQYQPIMDQLRHTHQLPPTLISSTNIASSTLTSLMADPPSSSSSSSSSTLSNLDTQLKKLTQVQRGGPMEVITEGKEELNEIKFVDDHVSQPTLKSVVETSSTSTTSVSSSPMNSKLKRKKRIELRYLRELSLRQEEKLKRMAKIKSKTYRKILKRDQLYQKKKRLQMNLEEISPEKKKELQYQLECERAEQRLTLKKKNTWTDQLNLLTSTSTSSSSSTSLNVTAMQPPSSDEEDEVSPKEKKETIPKKGLFAMKFMRRDLEMDFTSW
ncbi:hypothetical protein HMI54_012139 [Coelomomyces lativittatus]|nr:hypothetical protein HMI56_004919 [Coelomomyces lativittatus]KAJ1499066.1 hypothetical protein HMI54_012139 [Coelomomyces lativittatus]